MKKIECKNCGWKWNEGDGGDDKYMCHICNNDNSKYYLKESEEPKKKLFIPRKIEGEGSRWEQWNNKQPIKDGNRINQYDIDGRKQGYWEEYWDHGPIDSKGSYINGRRDGYWEEYYHDGDLHSKGKLINGKQDGIWKYYDSNGKLERKSFFENGKLFNNLQLIESEEKKNKLFIPRRVDERYVDLLRNMITTSTDIGSYLKRKDSYKDLPQELDPLVMKLPKNDLITFVKANPFWLNSIEKVDYLLKTLNYKENKDIAEHHIGQVFSRGNNFFTTPELKYYEGKFAIPKSNYGNIDTYVFVGSDEFKETKKGSFKKVFDIERLMKVSLDDWRDTKDYGLGVMIKMMRLRASANNKQLFKISANKGLLDDYEGETGSEIPEFILMSIDQKKERI